jgi:16S rRNA processing protein RimM
MELTLIGTITASKGLNGAMLLSDTVKGIKTLPSDIKIFIGYSEKFAQQFTLLSFKKIDKNALIHLKEIDSPELADKYREQGVFINKDDIKKNKINRIDDELIGFKAYDFETGKLIGEITDVWELPQNEVWVVSSEHKEYPIPAVDEFIKEYNDKKRLIKVKLIEGLENLNGNADEL